MAESLSNWLALREAADASARSMRLTRMVADRLADRAPICAIDLGTGTGSNLRYLVPHLGATQRWLLVDRDPEVLADLPRRMAPWAADHGYAIAPGRSAAEWLITGEHLECHVETRGLELGHLDDPALFAGRHLVTASALLDLVSDGWLASLASRCRDVGATALFTLTYDGRSTSVPREPEDEVVRDLMNRHQRSNDKGFGRAAGPDAVASAARAFADAGFHVERATSDWALPADAFAMQRELVDGWAEAALEIDPARDRSIRDWLARRLRHIAEGRSVVTVGHEDLAAWP
jgi:hypothetical protein